MTYPVLTIYAYPNHQSYPTIAYKLQCGETPEITRYTKDSIEKGCSTIRHTYMQWALGSSLLIQEESQLPHTKFPKLLCHLSSKINTLLLLQNKSIFSFLIPKPQNKPIRSL